jgi:hypothetical protein
MADHYLVLNRFDDDFGRYHDYVRGLDCRLAYLTLPAGLAVLDTDNALATVVLDSLEFDTVLERARALVAEHGPFQGVVGISERDVLTAARLREELGVPGYRPELVTRFLDKPRMKELVAAAGLRVPGWITGAAPGDAARLVARLGLPMVAKPRSEAASRGVRILPDEVAVVAALAAPDGTDLEFEEYIAGTILHTDGVRRGGKFHYVSVSEYVSTCLAFLAGKSLGSVLLDPGPRRDEAAEFTAACLDALGLDDGAFHFELFRTESGELVFLEVGIRPGGGEIGFVHRDVLGIDLFGEAFRAALGLPPLTDADRFADPSGGGFVMVPERGPLPSRVVARTPMTGRVPEVYGELLPEVGAVFDGRGGYYRIGGRFWLRGRDEAAIRAAVDAVIDTYELEVEPVEAPGRELVSG